MERQQVCQLEKMMKFYNNKVFIFNRFFLGKNRVIAIALGKSKEDESSENIHEISKRLKGQCGILFTDKPKKEVLK